MDDVIGRRLEDVMFGELPDDCDQPGTFWKYLRRDGSGEPETFSCDGKLTDTVWGFCSPINGIGTLRMHTVREHDDGTISVAPGDGSSNSIAFTGANGHWHGFIDHGRWYEA